jgi:hypothetical protein
VRTQANIVTPECSSDYLAYQAIKEIVDLVTDEYAEGIRFVDKDDLHEYMIELMKKDHINIVDYEEVVFSLSDVFGGLLFTTVEWAA